MLRCSTNRKKVEKQRDQKEKELSMGFVEPASMRLRDFMKDNLERTGDQVRESTQRETKSAMNDFIKTIGNIDFKRVSLTHGELYIQKCLDRGNTKETVAKKLRHIKRVFTLAVNRKQLDENPLQYIAIENPGRKKINIYTNEQCQRILKAAREYNILLDQEESVKWERLITVAVAYQRC